MSSQVTNTANPLPQNLIPSQGNGNEVEVGSYAILAAGIAFSELINLLINTSASFATTLANDQNTISQQEQSETQQYYDNNIQPLIDIVQNGGKLSNDQQAELQTYNTQLGVMQASYQSATKQIDPVLTSTQNLPSSQQQSLNEFLQEIGTVVSGIQYTANNRIN